MVLAAECSEEPSLYAPRVDSRLGDPRFLSISKLSSFVKETLRAEFDGASSRLDVADESDTCRCGADSPKAALNMLYADPAAGDGK